MNNPAPGLARERAQKVSTPSARMKRGFLVPVYRHAGTACPLAERLAASGLPVILVDDGNEAEEARLLAECAAKTAGVVLAKLEKNRGKGAALEKGLKKAVELGLTHVLQIDADGQHDAERAAFFLEESARHPDKVICGFPEFDESAPPRRVAGRRISIFWAAVATLSNDIKDALCGFRVYPVEPALRAIKSPFVDKRMGMDAEILVRLYWKKAFPLFYPVKVSYPKDGISNFRMVRDNIRISCMFARLCVGMFLRLPMLIALRHTRKKEGL